MTTGKNSTELPSPEAMRRLMTRQRLTAPLTPEEIEHAQRGANVNNADRVQPADQLEKVQNQSRPQEITQVLALSSIDPPTISQRATYSREMVDRMATAIRRQALGKPSILDGQINPIIVVPHPEKPGRYIIVDGFTRYQAFESNVLSDSIKATIRTDLTEAESFAMAFSANVDRNDTSDFDRGMALTEAFRKGLYVDRTEAAKALGIDRNAVVGLLAFAELPKSVISQIQEKPENFSYAYANRLQSFVNKGAPEDVVAATAKKIAEGTLSFKKFSTLVTDYAPNVTKAKQKKRRDTRNILGYGKARATENALSIDLDSLPENIAPELLNLVEQTITNFLRERIPSEAINSNAKNEDGGS